MSALFRQMRTIGIALPMILLLASCGIGGGKQLNRRISLSRHDDIPYGTKVAYESLPHLFPDATITVNSNTSPLTLANSTGTGRAYLVIGSSLDADASDIAALMNFIQQGNIVFISANRVSQNLLNVDCSSF